MSDLERAAAKLICIGFPGTRVDDEAAAVIRRGASGAVLFRRNVKSGAALADLCADLKDAAGRPFLTCVDQEGGRVMRLGPPFTQVPAMRAIGDRDDASLARQVGTVLGRELRAANVDMDLAPVLDVDTNPANPVIGDRSFGRSPDLVARLGCALIDGLQAAGVAACAKHFPGHGDTAQDSHLTLPRLSHAIDRLRSVELPPFAAAIKAGVAAIMTAHVVFEPIDPIYPATMSRPVLSGILREQLGFDGVVISDDLEMKAIADRFAIEEVVTRGLLAGVDLFVIAHRADLQHRAIDGLIAAVEHGEMLREALDAAGQRIDRMMERYVRPPVRGPLSAIIGGAGHTGLVRGWGSAAGGVDPTEPTP